MGYRPRARVQDIRRAEGLSSLQSERANYLFLMNEMDPAPGSAVHESFLSAIADVDARIELLASRPPLPPANASPVQKGYAS